MPKDDPLSAVSALANFDEDQLYAELGKRLQAIGFEPQLSAQFGLSVESTVEVAGAAEDFRKFGRRFFSRLNRQAYGLVCGADPADKEERKKLADAVDMGKESFSAALATLLVAQFGIAPAIATVAALLIVRLFFRPVLGAMCDVWKDNVRELDE